MEGGENVNIETKIKDGVGIRRGKDMKTTKETS